MTNSEHHGYDTAQELLFEGGFRRGQRGRRHSRAVSESSVGAVVVVVKISPGGDPVVHPVATLDVVPAIYPR
ncbi:hypothetical protein G6016_11135 [Dietzia aerolata]|uniref:Uncharacterized protein n=1 Tax=Dietzia aerolata TaxID=595984 RepID=A0ABV5JKP0_9ACTN|nr:hypothetical protein [Dietzia aerolata]MBB0969502.1 hypothetical protein [Dietzia aerolata]